MTGVQTCALPICFPVTIQEVTANSERTGVKDAAFFAVGNMVFMGAGSYSVFETLTTDFWSYNVSTKVWTRLKDAPISKFVKSFVYKNRCFAIGSDNNLYEYGVGNDSWTIVEKIPYTIDAARIVTGKQIGRAHV